MGVATGIAIGSAIAAAYAAHKQSQSAEEARNAETSAGDKALAVQERMYQQQRQDDDPYRSAGRVALGNLGDLSQKSRMVFDPNNPSSLLGPPKPTLTAKPEFTGWSDPADAPPAQSAPSAPAPSAPTPPQGQDRPWWQPPPILRPPGFPGAPGGPGGPLGPGLPNLPKLPGSSSNAVPTASLGQPGGAQGPSGSGAGQMVLMESPDGERRPVPQSMVQQFQQRGGKVVQ